MTCVNPLRYPLRINVGFLLNQAVGTYRDIHFEFPELKFSEDLDTREFRGVVRLTRTPQGILAHGDFQTSVKAECVRCLSEFYQPLVTTFDELYAFTNRSTTESGLKLPEDANLDFAPLLREYFLLEVPISPLCRADCKGLCMECGTNLNEATCEHEATRAEQL